MDDLGKMLGGLTGGGGGGDIVGAIGGLVGGEGGLSGLIDTLGKGGLDDVAKSWISTGGNKSVDPAQLGAALGDDKVNELAQKSGLPVGALLPLLASALPAIIDALTPDVVIIATGGLPQNPPIEAGGDLYANGFTTFRTVTLPLSMPGVLAGTLLTFIPAAGDYVNAELLGSDISTKMVGNVIESQFFKVPGGFPTAASLSFTLMALILVLVMVYVRRFGTEELV